jgi:hypothetical protein
MALTLSAIVVLCPLPSNIITWTMPLNRLTLHPFGMFLRPELTILKNELFDHQYDPNRTIIESIKAKARTGDEILVNYEDMPFMFYMDNPIRGGVPCFRVEDRSSEPRFLVIRNSVRDFMHWSVYEREFRRQVSQYQWERIPLAALDIPFGNIPEPDIQPAWVLSQDSQPRPDLILAERMSNAPGLKK